MRPRCECRTRSKGRVKDRLGMALLDVWMSAYKIIDDVLESDICFYERTPMQLCEVTHAYKAGALAHSGILGTTTPVGWAATNRSALKHAACLHFRAAPWCSPCRVICMSCGELTERQALQRQLEALNPGVAEALPFLPTARERAASGMQEVRDVGDASHRM